jgi:hypothetical protein
LAKVPVNGPVATKEQNGIDFVWLRGHANPPLHELFSLKGLEIPRRTTQSENGRSAHLRGRE